MMNTREKYSNSTKRGYIFLSLLSYRGDLRNYELRQINKTIDTLTNLKKSHLRY